MIDSFWVHLAGFLLGVFYAGYIVGVVLNPRFGSTKCLDVIITLVFAGLLVLLARASPDVLFDSIIGFFFGFWSILWAGESLEL